MPPLEHHRALTKEEKDLFYRWIEQGAEYDQHWAFVAPTRPTVPAFAEDPPTNAIDAFIRKRLEQEGLTFSAEADRATLIRRLSFDLTGLPPKLEEVYAFVSDPSPDAYEKQVDRLLASPHFGGAHGFDVAGCSPLRRLLGHACRWPPGYVAVARLGD